MKTLLFINGEIPKKLPSIDDYQIIACTDGALKYLKNMGFDLDKLDFISGDLDSVPQNLLQNWQHKIIETPDQNKTDLHKALDILLEKSATEVYIYGASGKEQDHFLGNLTCIFQFKNQFKIKCVDNFSTYYFLENQAEIKNIKNKIISLYPFPEAKNISTKGLKWELFNENLHFLSRIGTRNIAQENSLEISFTEGNLLIFIGK